MATPNKAKFRIVGDVTSPSTDRGYNATNAETLLFELEDSTGVLSAFWEAYDPSSPSSPLATKDAPQWLWDANDLPGYTNGTPPYSALAQVPTPGAGEPVSNSYFVRCTAVTAAGEHTFTRCINNKNGIARKPVPGESIENSTRGWGDDLADLIEAVGPALYATSAQQSVLAVEDEPGWNVVGAFRSNSTTSSSTFSAIACVSDDSLLMTIRLYDVTPGSVGAVAGAALLINSTTDIYAQTGSNFTLAQGHIYQVQVQVVGAVGVDYFGTVRRISTNGI